MDWALGILVIAGLWWWSLRRRARQNGLWKYRR